MILYSLTHGEAFDLDDGFSIALKKQNILFAFDSIQMERSLSFDIPATPRNDAILMNAKDAHNHGWGMRQQIDAELQDGLVSIAGYLIINEYSERAYKAVFYPSGLMGLKMLKMGGKISENVDGTRDITIWSAMPGMPAQFRDAVWAQINYRTDNEQPYPSVRLHTIIERAMQNLGVQVSLPTETRYVRYIPGELKGAAQTRTAFTGTGGAMSTTTHAICYTMALDPLDNLTSIATAYVRRVSGTLTYMGTVRQLRALQELQVTFPDTWDDTLFVGKFLNGDTNLIGEFEFYGDRSFDETGAVAGESLRGRTITIPRGELFCVISVASYVNTQTSSGQLKGWALDSETVAAYAQIEGGKMDIGSSVRLADNMPDIDLVEALKIVAALSGKMLNYTDARGVFFVDGTPTERRELLEVLSLESVSRGFNGWAVENLIEFKGEEGVKATDRVVAVYPVLVASLDIRKTLLTIPFSEGMRGGSETTPETIYTNAGALANAMGNSLAMVRLTLPTNALVNTLCAEATGVTVKVRQPLFEFQRLSESTAILYDNLLWAWTEANWADGVVTYKLAKIGGYLPE